MKKITFLTAAAAMMALAANAQYTCDPATADVVKKGVADVSYITLSDAAVADFEKAGAKTQYIGPDPDNGRNLWYWDNTFVPGDESMPRVDMEEGGYISVQVGNVGWSGAGLAVDAPGINLSTFNDQTRFHMAYMTPTGNGPAAINIILLNKDDQGSIPASFSLGDAFVDNGSVIPTIAPKISDEWQGIDLSFADLKKIWPKFNLANKEAWQGNVFSWLGGGVAGQTMAFDAVYFYNVSDGSGVEGVEADAATFVVTGNTINVAAGAGIELYNLGGQLVKATEGTTLGLNGLATGVYVAKSGNAVRKVVVR